MMFVCVFFFSVFYVQQYFAVDRSYDIIFIENNMIIMLDAVAMVP